MTISESGNASKPKKAGEKAHVGYDSSISGAAKHKGSERMLEMATQSTDVVKPSKCFAATMIFCVASVNLISSMTSGLITIALPTLVQDLSIPPSLMFWPSSIYALTTGCTLIILGVLSDAIGARTMYLIGCALQSTFTLATALARTSFQIIFFRGLAGIAVSISLPATNSLITTYLPAGYSRNFAFAALGAGQPIGFALGLTIGGAFVHGPGWRIGFYVTAGLNTVICVLAIFGLPKMQNSFHMTWGRLIMTVDWVGASILTATLALFSYALAALTGDINSIRTPGTILSLALAAVLALAFVFWIRRQEHLGQPAILPNSLWRCPIFTSICINVLLFWGAFNAVETLFSFYFQHLQRLDAIQASFRFLPEPIAGTVTSIVVGLLVHKVSANWAIIGGLSVSALSPLLLAVADPNDTYWRWLFISVLFNPIGADVLFTVSNLLIATVFPDDMQGLAGGVFNTLAQVGKSIGIALLAVISRSVTESVDDTAVPSGNALLSGYRAGAWFCLGLTLLTILVSLFGLGGIGIIGATTKEEMEQSADAETSNGGGIITKVVRLKTCTG